MSISAHWMVDLLIVNIKNTIVKASDINDIIENKWWGRQLDESKSFNK